MPNRRDENAPGRKGSSSIHHLPPGLEDLSWELPPVFLGLDGHGATPAGSGTWIVPVPYEATTSWGGGTRYGPAAILAASRYIELFDHELDRDPSLEGVFTFPALILTRGDAAAAMAELRTAFDRILQAAEGRRVLMIGGEHAVSSPPILAHAARLDGRLSVLQLDAHLDLRPELDGSPHSHGCAMTHVIDDVDLVSVGVRGISREEWDVVNARPNVHAFVAEKLSRGDAWMDEALACLGEYVYITFDVDFLDPGIMPSTGTPEPGGGDWYGALRFLRRVFESRTVVGVDVVEHAPIPGMSAPDFLSAKLIYKMLGYWSGDGGRSD